MTWLGPNGSRPKTSAFMPRPSALPFLLARRPSLARQRRLYHTPLLVPIPPSWPLIHFRLRLRSLPPPSPHPPPFLYAFATRPGRHAAKTLVPQSHGTQAQAGSSNSASKRLLDCTSIYDQGRIHRRTPEPRAGTGAFAGRLSIRYLP